MSEQSVEGGVVGPTFACIIGKQFENIKKGDRLFFTHKYDGYRGGLPPNLRNMIRNRTLSDILCDNIPTEELPRDIFNISSEKLRCSENTKLNFNTVNSELNKMLSNPDTSATHPTFKPSESNIATHIFTTKPNDKTGDPLFLLDNDNMNTTLFEVC